MAKPKNEERAKRKTHSVRIDPELVKKLKYIGLDEDKLISDLVEEGIEMVIAKREKGKGSK